MGSKLTLVLLCLKFSTVLAETVPWKIEAATQSQILSGMAALDAKISEIDTINIDLSYKSLGGAKFLSSFIFSRTAGQLRVVFNALFDAEQEKSNIVNKTFTKIDGVRTQMVKMQDLDNGLETNYGKENAVLKRKIWRAMNTSIESIWKALRPDSTKGGTVMKQAEVRAVVNNCLKVLNTTINDLGGFVQSFVKSLKLCEKEINKLKPALNSNTYFDRLIKQVNDKVAQCVNELDNTVTNLNATIYSSFTSLLKNKLLGSTSAINHLLLKLNETSEILLFINSAFQLKFSDNVNHVLSTYFRSVFDYALTSGLDRTGLMIFESFSKYEVCSRKYPLTKQIFANYMKLVERCVQKQLDYLPNIVLMMKELLAPFREVVFGPDQSLKSCSKAVGDRFCYPDFGSTFMGNVPATEISEDMRMMEKLNKIVVNIYSTVNNEAGSAFDHIDSCLVVNYPIEEAIGKFVKTMNACGNKTVV